MVYMHHIALWSALVISGTIFGAGAGADQKFNWVGLPPDIKNRIMEYVPVDSSVADSLTSQLQSKNHLEGRHPYAIADVAYDPSGKRIAEAPYGNKVVIRDAKTGTIQTTLTGTFEFVRSIAFHPDGARMIIAAEAGIYVHDIATNVTTFRLNTGSVPTAFAVSKNGRYVAASVSDYNISVWSLPLRRKVCTFFGHTDLITSLAYLSDGTLVSGSYDKSVGFHLQGSSHFMRSEKEIRSIAVSPCDDAIAVGKKGGGLSLFSADRKYLGDLTGHTRSVKSMAFHPTQLILSTGSFDCTVRLWNTETGACMHTMPKHTNRVNAVAFAPNGSRVLCGTWGRKVYETSLDGIHFLRQWVAGGCKPTQSSFSFLNSDVTKSVRQVDPLKLRLVVADLLSRKRKKFNPSAEQAAYARVLPSEVQNALGASVGSFSWNYSKMHDFHSIPKDSHMGSAAAAAGTMRSSGKDEESNSE